MVRKSNGNEEDEKKGKELESIQPDTMASSPSSCILSSAFSESVAPAPSSESNSSFGEPAPASSDPRSPAFVPESALPVPKVNTFGKWAEVSVVNFITGKFRRYFKSLRECRAVALWGWNALKKLGPTYGIETGLLFALHRVFSREPSVTDLSILDFGHVRFDILNMSAQTVVVKVTPQLPPALRGWSRDFPPKRVTLLIDQFITWLFQAKKGV